MDCKECNSRMRIEKNVKISDKEFNVTYICTGCGIVLNETFIVS